MEMEFWNLKMKKRRKKQTKQTLRKLEVTELLGGGAKT